MKVRIAVTTEDIAKGRPRQPCECPIALAIKRRFGSSRYVTVGNRHATRHDNRRISNARLPIRAQHFIRTFDRGGKVVPSTFVLVFD